MPTRRRPTPRDLPAATARRPGGRQLVLVLEGRGDGALAWPPARPSRHRFDHAIVVGRAGDGAAEDRRSGEAGALSSWRLIGSEFPSACLGILAEPGAATAAVAAILEQGVGTGCLPGAVALLGYDRRLAEACLARPPTGGRRPGLSGGGIPAFRPRQSPPDRPPLLVLLPADDPSVEDCAAACRRMRSDGMDARLEVMAAMPAPCTGPRVGTLGGAWIEELDAFFEANLEPWFPRMPRQAS